MVLPPRITVERVVVLVRIIGDDLTFRIIVPEWISHACSPVITMKDASNVWDGNPYGVYGDAVAEYVGCSKYDISISVARCHSGEI